MQRPELPICRSTWEAPPLGASAAVVGLPLLPRPSIAASGSRLHEP